MTHSILNVFFDTLFIRFKENSLMGRPQEARLNHNRVKNGHKNARCFSRNLRNFDEEFKSICKSERQARVSPRIFLWQIFFDLFMRLCEQKAVVYHHHDKVLERLIIKNNFLNGAQNDHWFTMTPTEMCFLFAHYFFVRDM